MSIAAGQELLTAFGSELLGILGRGNQRHVGSAAGKRCQNNLGQVHESRPSSTPAGHIAGGGCA